jgi:hypothetical protein
VGQVDAPPPRLLDGDRRRGRVRDPGTWLAVAATVAAAALGAALVPALRASRVDPIEALRQE